MSGDPQDPLTHLAESAVQVHEAFMTYVNAGFTRREALQLIIAHLQSAQGSGS